jgi:predicted metalloprotease with PDZ domain
VRFLAEVPPGLGIGNGPRIDLRRDQGGLIGLGEGFLPHPAVDEEWDVIVRWENTDAYPNGIRAVSSLGEGHEVRAQGRPGRIVDKTYFAVGRLGRWPPWGEDEGQSQSQSENEGPFAMYWVREAPPWDLDRLGERIKMLTAAVRNFFGEGKDSFRMFWRRAARGYGGAGGFRSFMMEFMSLAGEELSIDELENLISHESVHGYALMNPVRQQDVWYREGVATYYAVMAPFLAGVVDGDYFVRCMNNNAQAYYTGGTTGLNWTYVLQNYWTSTPLVRTSYFRGFIYLAQVHGLVQQATDGTKGLDDVVLALYQRYKTDAVTQGEQFVAAVAEYVGNTTAAASFDDMTSGKLVIPATDSFAKYGLKLVRQDAEKLELGFSEASFGGVITGLVAGSRAEEAGIREGDKVVRFWSFSTAADSLDNKMKVVIERDGQQSTITYSPRSRNKVECYQWVRMGAA